jgi:hypothetical protein
MLSDARQRRRLSGRFLLIAPVVMATACQDRMSYKEALGMFFECKDAGQARQGECFVRHGGVAACRRAASVMPSWECWSSVAAEENRVEICDEIAQFDERIDCVRGVAAKSADASVCARIATPRHRDECVDMVAGRRAIDVSVCDFIGNPFRRDACRERHNNYFRGAACPHIEDANRRDACYLAIVKSNQGTLDSCDKIVWRKAECLLEFAREHPEVCERVGSRASSIPRTLCYETAFGASSGRLSCTGLAERMQRLECEARLAVRANDSSICTTMLTNEDADECWNSVARSNGDSCLKIQQPVLQHQCLREYWSKSRNARICSFLAPSALAKACADHFRRKAGESR